MEEEYVHCIFPRSHLALLLFRQYRWCGAVRWALANVKIIVQLGHTGTTLPGADIMGGSHMGTVHIDDVPPMWHLRSG
jgi:hypothetical protein